MLILVVRTDKPEAEIGLYDGFERITYESWQAHRELAETLHTKVQSLLAGVGKDWHDIQAIVGYKGPGSFTGLRIGLTVVNTLAGALNVPIVGSTGKNWIVDGTKRLAEGENDTAIMPEYGSEPHITAQKK